MNDHRPERVLLAHSYFLFFDAKQTRKMRPFSPLATLITASVLREQGHAVSLFDSMLAEGIDEFRLILHREKPDVVGFFEDNFNFLTKMCTTRMRDAALQMIREAREAGARVVVNGSDASDRPHLYLQAGAEAILIGETEEAMPEVMAAWRTGKSLDLLPGLVLAPLETSIEENNLRRTDSRSLQKDLDSLPLPAWDLLDVDRYRDAWTDAHGRFSWNMVTTRGCPYQCNWCAKPLYGRRYAQRSPANVAEEVLQLKNQIDPDHIWFADDIFGLTPNWISGFAEELQKREVRIPFTMQSRVDLMSESTCQALARAGAHEVWLGVESGAQKILDAMDKETTLEQVAQATRDLKTHGVRPSWFLQLGYPGEDWPEILATRDLIREHRPHDVGVSVSYPLPGTKFYDRVQAQISEKTNWTDSDDLAMLFSGTYVTEFYRKVRDLLHEEAVVASHNDEQERLSGMLELDGRWQALNEEQADYRSAEPTRFTQSGLEV